MHIHIALYPSSTIVSLETDDGAIVGTRTLGNSSPIHLLKVAVLGLLSDHFDPHDIPLDIPSGQWVWHESDVVRDNLPAQPTRT